MAARSLLLLALFMSLAAGCVSTNEMDSLRADLNTLRRDTFELQKDMGAVKQLVSGAAKEETFMAIRESQSSLVSQVNDLSKDLQNLRGRFDENKFFIDKSLKDSASERELFRTQLASVEARMKDLSEKLGKSPEAPAEGKQPAEPPETKPEEGQKKESAQKTVKPAVPAVENDPTKAYEAAYSLFEDHQYKDARELFNTFIRRFPKDAKAGSAQFWIGETYFAEKDYEGAILSYEALVKAYPSSEKMPAALYKQGLSFLAIEDKKTAKVIFNKVIDKYPDSRQAKLARERLAELEKKPAASKGKSKR